MTLKKRYLIILSLNTLMSLIFICAIPFGAYKFFRPVEYKNTSLISQSNFHKELYGILNSDTKTLNELPRGKHIFMVFTQKGGIIYSKDREEIVNVDLDSLIKNIDLMNNMTFRYRTEPFQYKGDYGIFVFMIDKKSTVGYLRLYLVPILIISTLIFFVIPAIINFKLLYSLKMSFYKLEEAAEKVSKGDFDLNLVRDSKDELHSFYESFNRMGLILKESRDQKARLLMSISHDLKTPLTSMKGYIEAFNDNMVPKEKTSKYFNIIKDKSNILEDRINTLVDYSKIETHEWKKTFCEIKLEPFLNEIVKAFKDDCYIYNRDFFYDINIPKGLTISGDQKLLMRAIENLLENAKRYTNESGKIEFICKLIDEDLAILIKDNGQGISDNDIKYIFEPFFRVDKTRNTKGMGMGLYTVKSIIENHKGEISCESYESKGSIFKIIISGSELFNS